MSNSSECPIVANTEQALLETLVKHVINDLNRLIEFKDKTPESNVKKQRQLLLNILLESDPESIKQANFLDNYLKGKTIDKYLNSFSSWAIENSISKLKQTIEKSKKLLLNLKTNNNLTLSIALENKVKSEPHLSDSLNRTTSESAVLNELEINIDQKDLNSLSDSNIFLVPNAVPILTSFDQTSSMKNESISDHELNVNYNNFSIVNSSTSQLRRESNSLSRIENSNMSLPNLTSSLNTHELNIDSRLGNLTGLQQSVNMTADQSLLNGNDSTLNFHELNIDTKSLTLSLTNTINPTVLDNENETINKFELNIDAKEDILTQLGKINSLKHAQNPNNSLQNLSSSINTHDLNIDSRLGNLTSVQQSVNVSANQSVLNIHELNTLNTTIQTTLPSENETINKFELNIDAKEDILTQLGKINSLKHAQNPNNSLQNLSSSINTHDLNIDSRLSNLTSVQQSVNVSANQSLLNIHELNTLNTTIQTTLPSENETINKFELNVDSKQDIITLSNKQTTLPSENETINKFELNVDSKQDIITLSNKASAIKSNQFDFTDVNKLMSIVSVLPIDMSILKTISLPKNEHKRELNSIDPNGSDSKRYKIDQASLLNETKKINHHHQAENKFNNRKNDPQHQANKTVGLHGANHTYYCNFVKNNGQKCTFITQYFRHFKKHLKNQNHGEQENFSQNIESSYYTSITPNTNLSSATTSSNANKAQYNQPKSNDRTSNSKTRFNENMGIYF